MTINQLSKPDHLDPDLMIDGMAAEDFQQSLIDMIITGRLYVEDDDGNMQSVFGASYWRGESICTIIANGALSGTSAAVALDEEGEIMRQFTRQDTPPCNT